MPGTRTIRSVVQADRARWGPLWEGYNRFMIGPTCYLQDLFTAENARGQGIGRALVEAVYERTRVAGASRLRPSSARTALPR